MDGKPIFLVYRTSLLPEPKRTADLWRNELHRLGIGDVHLCKVESLSEDRSGSPEDIGFDAAVEFAPDWGRLGKRLGRSHVKQIMSKFARTPSFGLNNNLHDYQTLVKNMQSKASVEYLRYRCVTPMWDNTARRTTGATTLVGSTPKLYGEWFQNTLMESALADRAFVFINAWNEWAEGNHLEPCHKWGHQYLESTKKAIDMASQESSSSASIPTISGITKNTF